MPQTDGCERVQTISCAKDYKRLLPLWRTTDAYAAMRETHFDYERIHHFQRVRYRVGPDTLGHSPEANRDRLPAAALQCGDVARMAAHLPAPRLDRAQGAPCEPATRTETAGCARASRGADKS